MSTSIGPATHDQEHLHLPAHLHHRHNGALDLHVMSCSASVPRFEASNERVLPFYTSMTTSIAASIGRVAGRREVESNICVLSDRLTKFVASVSDSVPPIDRPAARSAAKQILGRDARPTDPPG